MCAEQVIAYLLAKPGDERPAGLQVWPTASRPQGTSLVSTINLKSAVLQDVNPFVRKQVEVRV